ncbi:MAG: hypothetical protein K2K55_04535 [Duncaniella sp.]|nr:hypothetical protein [Duncaniella sp.]
MTLKHDISTQKISTEAAATLRLSRLFPPLEEASTLTVSCPPGDYSAARLAQAVEDVDARLLNLNMTAPDAGRERIEVELRVSHRNPASVARSLERYGFEVTATTSEALYTSPEEAADRVAELLYYINL